MLTIHDLMRFLLAVGLLVPSLLLSSTEGRTGVSVGPDGQTKVYPILDFDLRRSQEIRTTVGPTQAQLAAAARLRERVSGLEIKFNNGTGSLRHAFSLSDRLTGPSSETPVNIAKKFLRTNKALFNLSDPDLNNLAVVKNYRTKHTGVTHLILQPYYEGLQVFQSEIRVHVDRQGHILSVSGDYSAGLSSTLTPRWSAAEAVEQAAKVIAPDMVYEAILKAESDEVNRASTFNRGPWTQDPTAKLVVFPAHDRARLAWNVRLHLLDRLAWVDAVVDAQTGEVLYLYNLYKFDGPQGTVFPVHPAAGPRELRSFAGDPTASPLTWVAPLPNIHTLGNNVISIPAAKDPQQHFNFPFDNVYGTSGFNAFDLNGQTLRCTPNANGGYDAGLMALDYDRDFGTEITSTLTAFGRTNTNDGAARIGLGFGFNFFGTVYTDTFISANGFATFGDANIDASESWADLILGLPRIAALWDDFNTVAGGRGVYARTTGDRAVFTWNRVPQTGGTDQNTFQLVLYNTGVIDLSYVRVATQDAIVGLTRGGEFALEPLDLSSRAPVTGLQQGMAEKFPTREIEASTTNVFYQLNYMHDYLYRLGFDEAAGNFQVENFGRGGLGGDPVLGWPQHAGTNNAFFGTAEDGEAGFTGYYFFTAPPFAQVDSAFDSDVIYHEYVHGLSNRLVGGPFNVGALGGFQAGAMGEGWSDAYSNSINNDPVTGEYSTGNTAVGIRSVSYAHSPLVYGDFGNRRGPLSASGFTGGIALDRTFFPEVHDDGEVWATVMWDLRVAVGKATAEQLMTDGLKFTPTRPSMLDARDAIMIADVAAGGGANLRAIWAAFAGRGMGLSARSDNSDDTIVFQAYDTPGDPLLPGRQTLFFDDMTMGVNGWTVSGDSGGGAAALWHQSNRRGSAWYYGREDTATYNSGARNFGALTSPVLTLPEATATSPVVLEFDHFMRADGNSSSRDNGYIRVIDPATGQIAQIAYVNNNTVGVRNGESSQHEEINLSKFAGQTIQIQFYFDTLDAANNDLEGWYIDNVRVGKRIR